MEAFRPDVVRIPLPFGPLFNSQDQTRVPQGRSFRMANASTLRGIVESGPWYGSVAARAGAQDGDLAWGFFYASFGDAEEFLAVVQHEGDATAQLYTVDPETLTYTAVVQNDSDALHASKWWFAQYEDKIYAVNKDGGWWVRRVGGKVGGPGDPGYNPSDDWKEFAPSQVNYNGTGITVSLPPYVPYSFPVGTTATAFAESGGFTVDAEDPADDVIEISSPDNYGTSFLNRTGYLVIELPAGEDLSDSDILSFTITGHLPGGSSSLTNSLTLREPAAFAVTEDTATADLAWCQSLAMKPLKMARESDFNTWHFWGEHDLAKADKDGVRRIVIKFLINFATDWTLYLVDFTFGGVILSGSADAPLDAPLIEYGYAYYNPTTEALTSATQLILEKGQGAGERGFKDLPARGANVVIDPPPSSDLNTDGYTKIKVFRRQVVSTGGNPARIWRELGEVDNTGDPSLTDSNTNAELSALPLWPTLYFGSPLQTLEPEMITVWKQHLVVVIGRRVYFSFASDPSQYMAPPEDLEVAPSEEFQDTQGRTLYASPGRTESVMAFVVQDLLYLLMGNSVGVMIGDDAGTATPPRQLPGSQKVTGPRASCRYYDGAVLACEDGIWLLEATRATTGGYDNTYSRQEITREVRGAYAELLEGGGEDMVLVEHRDELWAFNGEKYLRLTKPDLSGTRHWESGEWPAVAAALSVRGRGLWMLFADGRMAQLADVVYDAEAEDPLGWEMESGQVVFDDQHRLVGIALFGDGTPEIEVERDNGAMSDGTPIVETFLREENRVWFESLGSDPGVAFIVRARGVRGRDTVKRLELVFEPDKNRGV